MRIRLSALTAAILLLSASVAEAAPYADIAKTPYRTAFSYLLQHNAVTGYPDGSARPYAAINRAEALAVILKTQEKFTPRMNWYAQHPNSLPLFRDVKPKDWFVPFLETGFEAGLTNGYPDGTFRAGNPIALAEALALVYRAQGTTIQPSPTGNWYDSYITQARSQNLISSREQIDPWTHLTRGQFLDIVYRSDTVQRQHLVAFQDPVAPLIAAVPSTGYVPRPTALVTHPVTTYTPPRVVGATSVPNTSPGSTIMPQIQFTITIPSLGIAGMLVTHPSDTTTQKGLLAVLQQGVGQLYALPGSNGKTLIYGHSSSYSWDVSQFTKIFRTVNKLKAGDVVYIDWNGKRYTYSVTYQEQVNPKDVSRYSGAGEELILYTCWPPDSIATRLLIHAKPVSTVAER